MESTAFWKCHCQFNSMSILISFQLPFSFHTLKATTKHYMKLARLTIGLFMFVNFMFHTFFLPNTSLKYPISTTAEQYTLPAVTLNGSCARIYKVLDKVFILKNISETAYGTENHKHILHFSFFTVIQFSSCKLYNTSPFWEEIIKINNGFEMLRYQNNDPYRQI